MRLPFTMLLLLLPCIAGCKNPRYKPLLSNPATDIIESKSGRLVVTPVQHGSFIIASEDYVIFVDPVDAEAFLGNKVEADLILVTHAHRDHFNAGVINRLKTDETKVILAPFDDPEIDNLKGHGVLKEGQKLKLDDKIFVQAFAMYNTTNKRHVRGQGNGYILTLAEKTIYISGDTEDTIEMKSLHDIDVAFVCMNLPYTMSAETAAEAVLKFKPAIV